MNALEKVVDILVTIVIMFLVPILFFRGQYRMIKAVSTGQYAESFLQRSSTQGKIPETHLYQLFQYFSSQSCEEISLKRIRTLSLPGELGVKSVRVTSDTNALFHEINRYKKISLIKGDILILSFRMDGCPVCYTEVIRRSGNLQSMD